VLSLSFLFSNTARLVHLYEINDLTDQIAEESTLTKSHIDPFQTKVNCLEALGALREKDLNLRSECSNPDGWIDRHDKMYEIRALEKVN